jgi:hypothetical protein
VTAPLPSDPAAVPTPAGWKAAAPWLPDVLRRGSVYEGPGGYSLRVNHAGLIDIVQFGSRPHGGVASDPALRGKPRRYP